jgi:DNA-binding SARP family transcriptional activator
MLKILLLGPPAILFNDRPLTIQRRQLRTLLFFLASKPEGVGRIELIIRFWPGTDESKARRQLRELLSKLRSQFPDEGILKTDQDRIWLDKNKVYVDMLHFQSLVQPAQNFGETNRKNNILPENLVEMLERAIDLWRSPAFLADIRVSNLSEFDSWMEETASSLELSRLQSLERLADHYSDANDFEKAIYYVQKALVTDNLNDKLHEQLLSLFYKAGRISEAQSYYSFLMEFYQREFGDIPPLSLRMTMDEVSRAPIDRRKDVSVIKPTSRSASRSLIGRTNDLETITSMYDQGGMILVTGEVGSGKTHFVRNFCASLEEHPRILYIHCRVQDENLPLQPFINMIREFMTRDDWEPLDNRWQIALSILVPDIIRKSSSIQSMDDRDSKEARLELFDALDHLLISASRSSRLVLVLDDIQWSDIDTLQALMHLSRQKFFANNCFLILVSRLEIENPKIQRLLLQDDGNHEITRMILQPLSLSDTGVLAERILGQASSQDFYRRLHKATGGNPLFITETLNALIETYGKDYPYHLEDIPLAENISDIVKEKEENLSDISIEVLSAAAICGMEFQSDVLEYLNLCSPEILVKCLEELERKKFIHPTTNTGAPRQYAFNHNLIRESLLKELSPARERLLHEKMAEAKSSLRGSQSNRQASIIARHFEFAGKPVLAFPFWIKAGKYARSLFSIEEAYGTFAKANAIRIEYTHSIPEEDLYSLYSEWGDLSFSLMDPMALDECYTAMYETGVETNNELLIGAGLSGLGLSAFFKLDLEKSLTFLEQSISILDSTGNLLEKIQVRYRYGMVLSTAGQNNKAIELYKNAIELGEGVPNQKIRQAITQVQSYLSLLYSLLGLPQKAKEVGKLGIRNGFLLISKPATQSAIYASMAIGEYYSGEFFESLKNIHQSLKLVENMENQRILALMQILEARINCIQGRLDVSWDLAQKALDRSIANNYFENVADAHCVMGDIFLTLRIYDEAIREYSSGCKNVLGTFPGLNNYFRLGYVTALNGEMEKGFQILYEAIDKASIASFESVRLPARLLQAKLYEKQGKLDDAKCIMDDVLRETEARCLSLLTFPDSKPFVQKMWEEMDNPLTEQIILNLMEKKAIRPGDWIERLITKINNQPHYSKKFDYQRLTLFLRSIKNG